MSFDLLPVMLELVVNLIFCLLPVIVELLSHFTLGAQIVTPIPGTGLQLILTVARDVTNTKLGALAKKELSLKQVEHMAWMLTNANEKRIVLHLVTKDIQQSQTPVTSKGGFDFWGSYSLTQTRDPIILDPGYPPLFNDYKARNIGPDGLRVQPDMGKHWVDQHADKARIHQFEPLFQMLAILYPNVRLNKIHIVINRSSLMSLHKIANGKYCQLFHLDLDLIGDTLFIGRKTRNAKSTSNAYGHNFEAEFTTADPDFEGAEGYFRVIQYKLGDLEVVVRIEADAYMAAKRNPPTFAAPTPAELRESTPGIMHTGPQLTKVVLAGKMIPQDRIIELKSNDKSKPKEQMWFGRTPNSCCGSFQNENR
tara:strand:+ start:5105 stop:6202 length:1098 start_codon:yes stop_codon:yes gene_type:complete